MSTCSELRLALRFEAMFHAAENRRSDGVDVAGIHSKVFASFASACCIHFPPWQLILLLGQGMFSKIHQDLWNSCDNEMIKKVFFYPLQKSHFLFLYYNFSIMCNALLWKLLKRTKKK